MPTEFPAIPASGGIYAVFPTPGWSRSWQREFLNDVEQVAASFYGLDLVTYKTWASPDFIPTGSTRLFVSRAYTRGWAVWVGSFNPVGVDIEIDRNFDNRFYRYFSASELEVIAAADCPRRARLEIWTKKEAYLKSQGLGIGDDLKKIDTFAAPIPSQLTSFWDGRCAITLASPVPNPEWVLFRPDEIRVI